jgi:hypothetical protein
MSGIGTPEGRAAKRIKQEEHDRRELLGVDDIAELIREETAIDSVRERGEAVLAYLITRGGNRDLTLGSLMLSFLGALEKSAGVKYDALRRTLTEPPPQIIPARKAPGGGMVQ